MPVETNVTTPPTDPKLVPELKTNHPKKLHSLRAGLILSRPPLLTREQTPFEQAFYLYQKRLNERLATPFSRRFYFKKDQPATIDFAIKWAERGHTMERGIGRVTRSGKWAWDDELLLGGQGEALADAGALREALYTEAESRVSEDGERLSFDDRVRIERPNPRRTEADRAGDVRRLDRALDRTLYLIVRKDGLWRFPQDDVWPDEGLHETAARALTGCAGVNMNTWMVGRVPVAHEHREPVYTGGENGTERRIKAYGRDIFYLRARIMAGQVDLADNKWGVTDFKWLTKDELAKAINQQTMRSVMNSMPAR
ncbi:54s ribosomal protein l17 [Diaporthe amygdali]|uniref:54s ribosomal protein l17 n=1 Tax=Phomopsis amygdali TaxID=1214568 RepID=UPI0022FF2525|nr:54s ribosomal protein l17 [Diaporthe amygdali]KAJ0107593.1 54s ribosomal protein l17 [Diaporthe amygdali]